MHKNLKVTLVSMKDSQGGGAFTASYRLLLGLTKYCSSINMLVETKYSENSNVISLSNKKNKPSYFVRVYLSRLIIKLLGNRNNPDQTLAFFQSGVGEELNNFSTDIFNLHWIAGEMISIKEIGNISKPVVWTLHDEWPYNGIDHYNSSNYSEIKDNSFFDLESRVLQSKARHWKNPVHIVTPSNWLASCVRSSNLMKSWPVTVIPNIIDTELFKPLDKTSCRKITMLDDDKTIILFGAFAGIINRLKGFELLMNALDKASDELPNNSELVIFGQEKPSDFNCGKFTKVKWLGHIKDEKKMCELYNSADIVVVPSKVEAFGLVAAEAHACAVPVVAFRHSGIQEVVTHKKTGYLANPFESSDFASGIIWTLNNTELLSPKARQKACEKWAPDAVIPQYMELYKSVYDSFNKEIT